MTLRAHNIAGPASLALICAFCLFPGPAIAAPGQCTARIAITLDPEVADPRAPRFCLDF